MNATKINFELKGGHEPRNKSRAMQPMQVKAQSTAFKIVQKEHKLSTEENFIVNLLEET